MRGCAKMHYGCAVDHGLYLETMLFTLNVAVSQHLVVSRFLFVVTADNGTDGI